MFNRGQVTDNTKQNDLCSGPVFYLSFRSVEHQTRVGLNQSFLKVGNLFSLCYSLPFV